MLFFVSLLVNGILDGAIYALIALAFVVVYKSSRMINFAVGEWVMFGSLLVATGLHVLALGLGAAIILASAGMIGLACVFGHLVLRRLDGSAAGCHDHDHTGSRRTDAWRRRARIPTGSRRDPAAGAGRAADAVTA